MKIRIAAYALSVMAWTIYLNWYIDMRVWHSAGVSVHIKSTFALAPSRSWKLAEVDDSFESPIIQEPDHPGPRPVIQEPDRPAHGVKQKRKGHSDERHRD